MNTTFRRTLLGITVAISLYTGFWAAFLPEAFYRSFPGFGLHWIDVDGPYNEHLLRDVGGLYLALGAVSLAAIFCRSATPGRIAGLAWAVFGVLHLGYHVQHLHGSVVDIAGNIVTLGLSAALGVALLLPARAKAETEEAAR
ncbi:hypothetical protein [Microbacterium sp. NIBRBAC000506063]|uniref:hypothetical protein n=1 Tax=Microbacterium sp. NIBRBAC000506063 TaxID=2734618 RepID=UPI001BB4C124|nr:hypothetical protein [Microbacterium sp. NIBRBAC000506063]QTV79974.1 hypothetical protein KAE78_02090 [Microbacterium sp. NIBRBAC000506063]